MIRQRLGTGRSCPAPKQSARIDARLWRHGRAPAPRRFWRVASGGKVAVAEVEVEQPGRHASEAFSSATSCSRASASPPGRAPIMASLSRSGRVFVLRRGIGAWRIGNDAQALDPLTSASALDQRQACAGRNRHSSTRRHRHPAIGQRGQQAHPAIPTAGRKVVRSASPIGATGSFLFTGRRKRVSTSHAAGWQSGS